MANSKIKCHGSHSNRNTYQQLSATHTGFKTSVIVDVLQKDDPIFIAGGMELCDQLSLTAVQIADLRQFQQNDPSHRQKFINIIDNWRANNSPKVATIPALVEILEKTPSFRSAAARLSEYDRVSVERATMKDKSQENISLQNTNGLLQKYKWAIGSLVFIFLGFIVAIICYVSLPNDNTPSYARLGIEQNDSTSQDYLATKEQSVTTKDLVQPRSSSRPMTLDNTDLNEELPQPSVNLVVDLFDARKYYQSQICGSDRVTISLNLKEVRNISRDLFPDCSDNIIGLNIKGRVSRDQLTDVLRSFDKVESIRVEGSDICNEMELLEFSASLKRRPIYLPNLNHLEFFEFRECLQVYQFVLKSIITPMLSRWDITNSIITKTNQPVIKGIAWKNPHLQTFTFSGFKCDNCESFKEMEALSQANISES